MKPFYEYSSQNFVCLFFRNAQADLDLNYDMYNIHYDLTRYHENVYSYIYNNSNTYVIQLLKVWSAMVIYFNLKSRWPRALFHGPGNRKKNGNGNARKRVFTVNFFRSSREHNTKEIELGMLSTYYTFLLTRQMLQTYLPLLCKKSLLLAEWHFIWKKVKQKLRS